MNLLALRNPKWNNIEIKFGPEESFKKHLALGNITQDEIDLINKYAKWRKATSKRGCSDRRLDHMKIQLTHIKRYTQKSYTDLTLDDITDWIVELKTVKLDNGKTYARNTLNSYIVDLKGFLLYLSDKGYSKLTYKDIKESVKAPGMNKHTTLPKNIMTVDDIKELLKCTLNPMYKALLIMSWEAGARPEEMNALQWSDLKSDSYGYILTITAFKTENEDIPTRTARLTMSAPYIEEWKKISKHVKADDYIFVNRYGEPLTKETANRMVKRITARAGINKPLTLYSFRKGRINDMVKNRIAESVIRNQIWKNQDTQMLDTYLSMDDSQFDEMYLSQIGVKKEKVTTDYSLQPIVCPDCHTSNPFDAEFCKCCGHGITEKAIKERGERQDIALSREDLFKVFENLENEPELRNYVKKLLLE